jgi:hypothetical protein
MLDDCRKRGREELREEGDSSAALAAGGTLDLDCDWARKREASWEAVSRDDSGVK